MTNSFNALTTISVNGKDYQIYRLDALSEQADLTRLPYSLKILLENLLRNEDGVSVEKKDILTLAKYDLNSVASTEIAFTPARVVMQDFTGVPAIVDLAAMRDAMRALGGDPNKINPLAPAELVIDHSVMVDHYGSANAIDLNAKLEFQRNRERYEFLRWGQHAFANFKVVPPRTGIVHQVNLEHLAQVVFAQDNNGSLQAYPDTLVGTDSHTTMINGAGVLGWGVGGIEAEAAMLGQPISMLIPEVVGFKLSGQLAEGATATDLVLTIVQMLREHGVVGKFVEYFGTGLSNLPLADRATIANMAPEYGATCGIFPIDQETLRYLRLTGRSDEQLALVEAYAREQGMFREDITPDAEYSVVLELDMSTVVPSIAGPKRPQDRISLTDAKQATLKALETLDAGNRKATVSYRDETFELEDGDIVIAAITSCTNTSNPSVIMGAGLLAQKAVAKGLMSKPWVKTSLAPGSKVAAEYLKKAGLLPSLEQLGFDIVGYGCTTCIGNSGPLPEPISEGINEQDLAVAAVLSGNRNFEGRVHPEVRMNFLASPPLVVAYALAGTMDIDVYNEPLGTGSDGEPVYLKDIWPTQKEIQDAIAGNISEQMYQSNYADAFKGDSNWANIPISDSAIYEWQSDSTYIQNPPYFVDMKPEPEGIPKLKGLRVLAVLGDSITTDHISPAGSIKVDTPAGQYLIEHGVDVKEFNSYGSRRGNHEVMMRGTFANIRLRNEMAPGTEGGWTRHHPSDEEMFIFDAAGRYQKENIPLMVIGGKEYGSGSSRDWAAKGSMLLGIRVVIVESYERIHRSNLVGMGILPLQFSDGEGRHSLELTGKEIYDIKGFELNAKEVTVVVHRSDRTTQEFKARVRIDTPKEWEYYQHGGILHYVLRELAA